MAEHEFFQYRELGQVLADLRRLSLEYPVRQDASILAAPAAIGRRSAPNRLTVHPMEGCDATADGRPDELTFRRCLRFCTGGAGVVWFEATAVVPEGRANPRQLWLHEGSAAAFAELVRQCRRAAREAGVEPVFVLQLTHSGRYCRPAGPRQPIIAHHSPILDPTVGIGPDHPLVADDYLDGLQEAFARSAVLAAEAGFDGVDIKSCHRYLINELLASHTRPGRYGGSYENRTRFLLETVDKVRRAAGDRLEIACRLNVYDGLPHPLGWGVDAGGSEPAWPDLAEPLRLVGQLVQRGLTLLSVTAGNPYFRPHLNRPYDRGETSAPPSPEHPLEGVTRLASLAGRVQRAYPSLPVVGAGFSWLRQFGPAFAAGAVSGGWCTLAGWGRGALAYPDWARDVLSGQGMDPKKSCIACGRCSQIMRDGGRAGCVIRDSAIYEPIYRAGLEAAKSAQK